MLAMDFFAQISVLIIIIINSPFKIVLENHWYLYFDTFKERCDLCVDCRTVRIPTSDTQVKMQKVA